MDLVSPNEMIEAASEQMLDGRRPEGHDDWILVMNFVAFNVDAAAADPACQLVAKIYSAPVSEAEVSEIVAFQLERREQ
jgi:hypothetical protein